MQSKNQLVTKIMDYSPLSSALHTDWELQIYDGDKVIGEEEKLIHYFKWNKNGTLEKTPFTLLPIRNFFF